MIFNRMAQYGPRQDFGARHQQVFDREAMADMGGGMGRMRNPNGGINPNGMYTGGNTPPMVNRPQFQTGGNQVPAQMGGQHPWVTGGNTPPMQAQGWMTGGNQQPQFMGQPSALGMLYRRGAY